MKDGECVCVYVCVIMWTHGNALMVVRELVFYYRELCDRYDCVIYCAVEMDTGLGQGRKEGGTPSHTHTHTHTQCGV